MSPLAVSDYMSSPVLTVAPTTTLPRIAGLLDAHRFSAVAVVDDRDLLLGVVSRSDLLRLGRSHAGAHRGARGLVLPELTAGEVMTQGAITTAPDVALGDAARLVLDERVHRVFVVDGARLVGVLSTLDLAAAVRDARIATPIAELMSTPVISVRVAQPLSAAVAALDEAHVTGVVVVENDWPIGVFTQTEALACRDLARDTPIEDVYDPAILCMPGETRCHRAAAQLARLAARRVIACRAREMEGVVTGLDFARLLVEVRP
jgi:CBS domain-containing protein